MKVAAGDPGPVWMISMPASQPAASQVDIQWAPAIIPPPVPPRLRGQENPQVGLPLAVPPVFTVQSLQVLVGPFSRPVVSDPVTVWWLSSSGALGSGRWLGMPNS